MFNKQLFLGKSELAGHPLSFLSPFVPLNNLWGQVVQVFMVTAQKPIWGALGVGFHGPDVLPVTQPTASKH